MKSVDELILHDKQLARLLGDTKESAFADVLLGSFHLSFLLHREKLISPLWWEADENRITLAMKLPFMIRHWGNRRDQYDADFRELLDKKVSTRRQIGEGSVVTARSPGQG
jgi:hypothetical protein